MSAPLKVAVIGGGWAGCAAAVSLARAGHAVTLLEAARVLGGRARRVEIDDRTLDNGQHILLGAYSACLGIMREIGIDPEQALLRLPLQMRYPPGSGGIDFVAPRLPAPLHMAAALWRAKGMPRAEKWSLARFFSAMRWMQWQLFEDCPVSELLARHDQSAFLIEQLWQPLCVAALNTPPERASAKVFLAVLRDSLGARRNASDMLLPRVDLSALLPDAAAAYIKRAGGTVETGIAVQRLEAINSDGPGWRLHCGETGGTRNFSRVIIATPPQQAAQLLGVATEFSYEPISTCYLQYAPTLRLSQPFFALQENGSDAAWGQYVFDRGQLALTPAASQAGLLAVVVSSAGNAIAEGSTALTAGIVRQLVRAFGNEALATPLWSKIITEKRATFSCVPDLNRPSQVTQLNGVFLAGDYTISDYPATLESAVRSGMAAAVLVKK